MSPLKLRNASYLECHLKTEQLCLVSRLFLQVLSHINILIMWLLNKKQWFFNSSTIWKGNVKTISEVFIWMVTAFKWRSSIDLFYLQKPVPTHRLDIILHAVWKKRMWVAEWSFPEWGRVVCLLKARGEKEEYQSGKRRFTLEYFIYKITAWVWIEAWLLRSGRDITTLQLEFYLSYNCLY